MHGSYLPDNFILIDYAFGLLSQNGLKIFFIIATLTNAAWLATLCFRFFICDISRLSQQKTCKWLMSLKRREPFACFLPENGFYLSILMRDINHLMVNVCKWFTSLYFYERRKPFACHMKTGL